MILIRKFNVHDRLDVRRISCETAFLENAGRSLFDSEILADSLTLYFTDYEPGSCFVAVDNDRVVGYLTGASDIAMMNRIIMRRIAPGLIFKALRKGIFLRENNNIFLLNLLMSYIKGEFFMPDFSKKFPAILHINIDKNHERQGVGSRLIGQYLNFLRTKGVFGVHLCTISERGKTFFMKQGFSILFQGKRSYLRRYVKKNIPCYILGRMLS
jgi:GNAT superfamily N-acetyltransferase